jgi:ATP-dependent helicase/DNAse subunit B
MKLPKIKKFPYTNILGWSVSRYDVFNNCKRQYFYSYYPKFDKENSLEKITQLKSLTSFALEVGNIAHDVIRDLLFRTSKNSKTDSKKTIHAVCA